MSSSVAEKLAQKSGRKPKPRRVNLRLVHVDFWSVVKISFLLSICVGVIEIVLNVLAFSVLTATGAFTQIDDLITQFVGGDGVSGIIALPVVLGFSIVVAILDIVVLTVLGALGALIYNVIAKVTGGLALGFTNN
jgi:Transmembrane domain of unknown function (DUF3566)